MNCDREDFFRTFLTDHILVENPLDLRWFWYIRGGANGFIVIAFLRNNVIAEIDAFIADVNSRTGDEFPDLILALSTERADEISRSVFTVLCHRTPGLKQTTS
jgi:hypothetical protein